MASIAAVLAALVVAVAVVAMVGAGGGLDPSLQARAAQPATPHSSASG